MRQVKVFALLASVAAFVASPAAAQMTAYEGARVIVGDGNVIPTATIVVDNARIIALGPYVGPPPGARRVNLAGKTVMPMIIDTHVHLSATREKLINDLKRRAYFGVSAALSLGTDNLDLLGVRDEVIPGAARFFSAGRGITRPEPLRPTYQINSDEEARQAVRENVARKVSIIKIWVDDREGK